MKAWFWILIFLCSCKITIEQPKPFVLEYPSYFGKPHLPEDNPLTQEGVQLGRKLFFSSIFSSDMTISCASCHKPEYSFADNQDFTEGVYGKKVALNVPHLINLAWNPGPFGWEGKSPTIRKAIENAIISPQEMNGNFKDIINRIQQNSTLEKDFHKAFPNTSMPISRDNILKVLEQYVLTLVSSRSKYDLWKQGRYEPTESEKRGFELFFKSPKPGVQRGAGCGDCHTGNIITNGLFMNNGLFPVEEGLSKFTNNIFDSGKFKVPSLRNVTLTAPYMHNAKFKTLEEVIEHYNSHVFISEYTSPVLLYQQNEFGNAPKLDLTNLEKKDLIEFLKMLTDTSVVQK